MILAQPQHLIRQPPRHRHAATRGRVALLRDRQNGRVATCCDRSQPLQIRHTAPIVVVPRFHQLFLIFMQVGRAGARKDQHVRLRLAALEQELSAVDVFRPPLPLRPPGGVAVELRAVAVEREARLHVHERLLQVRVVHQLRDAVEPAAVAVHAQFVRRDLPTSLLRLGGERLGRDLSPAVQVAGGGGDARRTVRRAAEPELAGGDVRRREAAQVVERTAVALRGGLHAFAMAELAK